MTGALAAVVVTVGQLPECGARPERSYYWTGSPTDRTRPPEGCPYNSRRARPDDAARLDHPDPQHPGTHHECGSAGGRLGGASIASWDSSSCRDPSATPRAHAKPSFAMPPQSEFTAAPMTRKAPGPGTEISPTSYRNAPGLDAVRAARAQPASILIHDIQPHLPQGWGEVREAAGHRIEESLMLQRGPLNPRQLVVCHEPEGSCTSPS